MFLQYLPDHLPVVVIMCLLVQAVSLLHFYQASDRKTFLTTYFLYLPKSLELIFKTGYGIIQTGNGIISPTSWPLIKKLLLQHPLHITGVRNWFSKQEMELTKQELDATVHTLI